MTRFKSFVAAATVVTAIAGFSGAASANCNLIQNIGNNARVNASILAQINAGAAGSETRISRRKRLRVNRISRVSFSGCRTHIDANVTLKRRIRRNAHGNVRMSAQVSFATRRLCILRPRVDRIRLSRTTRLGEAVYRAVANRAMPSGRCYAITG